MDNIQLRDYQQRALEEALSYINDPKDKGKALMIAPTGAGKSIYIAAIANAIAEPIVILQPSVELLEQNYAKYVSYGNEAAIYSASLKKKDIGHVTFATVGSIVKEAKFLKSLGVKLILVDEAHLHTKKDSLINTLIKHAEVEKVIGLTATPIELRQGLYGPELKMIHRSRENLFSKIIHITQVKEIIANNYWAKLDYLIRDVDTSKLVPTVSRTDYTEESLAVFVNENNLHNRIYSDVKTLRAGNRKSIIIFMPSIHEAEILSEQIPGSICVTSSTPRAERDAAINKFKNREIDVIINVNILSIGFDHPGIDAIILARPTGSFAMYYQQIGRGVRVSPSKSDVVVIDYSCNVENFGRIEEIKFEQDKNNLWNMWCGDKCLTRSFYYEYKEYTNKSNNGVAETTFWFGKYSGKKINEVPISYLKWMQENINAESSRMEKFMKTIDGYLKVNPK
jgi:DNA repair protein RadD